MNSHFTFKGLSLSGPPAWAAVKHLLITHTVGRELVDNWWAGGQGEEEQSLQWLRPGGRLWMSLI